MGCFIKLREKSNARAENHTVLAITQLLHLTKSRRLYDNLRGYISSCDICIVLFPSNNTSQTAHSAIMILMTIILCMGSQYSDILRFLS